jgi:hypothetical protein
MTIFLALITFAIIGLVLAIGARLIEPYMLRTVYRRLPQDYVPADKLANDILGQLWNDPIMGLLFRLRYRDHIPILVMLDTLHAYGFAECDMRPDRKIEQARETLLLKTEILEAKGLDHARASAIRKLAKHISIPEIRWRKHSTRNREPGLLEFLPT